MLLFTVNAVLSASAAELSIAHSGSTDPVIAIVLLNRRIDGTNLVGRLQIENNSDTWVYIERDITSTVALPYTDFLLGPRAIKRFPDFVFPLGASLGMKATTPVGAFDWPATDPRRVALESAFLVDLLVRGLLTFSLPPDFFDGGAWGAIGGTKWEVFDTLVSSNGWGALGVAARDRDLVGIAGAVEQIAADSKHVRGALIEFLKTKATDEQLDRALGEIVGLIEVPEKARLLRELSLGTHAAAPSSWTRLEVVAQVPAETMTSVSPQTFTTKPLAQTQTLTIQGSGFTASSRLVFTFGESVYASRPERLKVLDANTITYDIAVGSAAGTWSVSLAEGAGSATFEVTASDTDSYTITPSSGTHGTISPSAPLIRTRGESQTFFALPADETFTVDTWYVDGVAVPAASNQFTLADIEGSHAVSVTFKAAAVVPSGDDDHGDTSPQATVLAADLPIAGFVSTRSDVDWFKIEVETPGMLVVSLAVPEGKDFDLELFGPSANFLKGSYAEAGAAEGVTYNASTVGTYYVRVYGYPVGNGAFSTTATYTLTGAVSTRTTGSVVAWGGSGYDTGQTYIPQDLDDVVAIAAGGYHNLALKRNGTVVAWGAAPINGWIADANHGQTNVPAGLTNVVAIAAGGAHSLALKADGTVVAWGSNYAGETVVPAGLSDVKAIAAGGPFSVALKNDGTVVAWGWNGQGQTTVPAGLNGVTAISAQGGETLALKNDGTVVAWGSIGPDTGNVNAVPATLAGVVAVSMGGQHALALKGDGTVAFWGWNPFGTGAPAADLAGVTAIAAGGYHSVALKSDGTLALWGWTGEGEGDIPTGLNGVTAIAAGSTHTIALTNTPPAGTLAITTQPTDQTALVKGWARFAIAVAGSPSPRVRWQSSSDGGKTWNWVVDESNRVTGSITRTLSLDGISQAMDGRRFRCIVANGVTPSFFSAAATLSVTRASQTIDFARPADRPFSAATTALTATSNSGLPVTYSVVSGPATVTGDLLTITGIGMVTVRASQPGNDAFLAAPDIERSFMVSSTFAWWQKEKFTDEEIADPALSGPNAIYGLDGLPNLVKYALGLEPKQNATAGLPTVSATATAWEFVYERPGDRTDVEYAVEVSSDLVHWTMSGVAHELVESGGGVETWRAQYPLDSTLGVFFRLRVTRY